jgi:hypothetical protein
VTTDKQDHRHTDVKAEQEADLVQDLELEEGVDADEVRGGAQSLTGDDPEPGVKLNHSERVLP